MFTSYWALQDTLEKTAKIEEIAKEEKELAKESKRIAKEVKAMCTDFPRFVAHC
jgi:hypothetical protein